MDLPSAMTPPSYTPGAALAGIAAAGQVRIFMQVDTPITVAVPRYGHLLDARLAAVACGRWLYADQVGGRPDLDVLGWSVPTGDAVLAVAFTAV